MRFRVTEEKERREATQRVCTLPDRHAQAFLRPADPNELANEIIARKIIELAKAGERDPDII
jgi:hypothetical protein